MLHKPTPSDLALWAALPTAHTSNIEKRLKMILDGTRSRRALTRRVLLTTLGTGAIVSVTLAMLKPIAHAQAVPPSVKRPMSQATVPLELEQDAAALEAYGPSLTPAALAQLKRRIAANPKDYAAHIQLLGYYGARKFTSTSSRTAYQQQVLWLIGNHPESALNGTSATQLLKMSDSPAFEQGKALWLKQVAAHPGNTVILSKAAAYCVISDNETAENLLEQAKTLEPKDPKWPNKLGALYQLQASFASPDARHTWADKALAEFEAAAQLSPEKSLQTSTSAALAKTAFEAGEYDKARRYATALLRRADKAKEHGGSDPQDDRHQANSILGRLALRDGNIASAETHLQAMGQVSGSPVLDTFGPNMQLAKELLEKGDRQSVLAYFDDCAKFWTMGNQNLALWKAQVQKGETPNFGANLVY